MNKKQQEQYKKALHALRRGMQKQYPGSLDSPKICKKLEKAARMIVLKNTLWYRIKRWFIFLGGRHRQHKIERKRNVN